MLNIKEIGLEIEGNEIFSNVNFDVSIGDKISLVGENGVGKSSLLKILSGNIQPSNGFIHKQKDLEISLMPQNLDKWEDNTVYEFTEEFTGVKKARENFDEACNNLTQIYTPKQSFIYEKSLKKYEHLGVYDFEQRLKKSLNNVGLKDLDINTRLKEISGGQKNRIALSAILTSKKDLILLDEPTNNLDSEGILILEKFINQSKSSFIIVSHNINFISNTSNKIIELIGGSSGVKQYTCNYKEYIEIKNKEHESEIHNYEENIKKRKKVEKQIKKKQNDIYDKGVKKKDNAKINNNFRIETVSKKKSDSLKSLKSKFKKIEEIQKPEDFPVLDFEFNKKEKINPNSKLINIENLIIKYNYKSIGPINLYIGGRERVLLTGKNGVGKTSIIKSIINQNEFIKEGNIELNPSINIGYIDQNQTLPLLNENAIDNLRYLSSNLPLNEYIHLLIKFNINKEAIYKKVFDLSGGERAKIILASIALNHSNIIILDEPTNNLDNLTVEALKKALLPYTGTLLIVSHNQDFIKDLNITRKINIE